MQGTQKRGSVVRWLVGSEVMGGRKHRSPSPDWSWQREPTDPPTKPRRPCSGYLSSKVASVH